MLDVPAEDAIKSTFYIARDVALLVLLYKFAFSISPWAERNFGGFVSVPWQKNILKSVMWLSYWWFHGLVNAGMFCLGMDVVNVTSD
jgi:hypothetical protein